MKNYFLPLLILVVFLESAAVAECSVESPGECSGFWNVYASIPGGDSWVEDYVGNKSSTRRITQQAEAIQKKLAVCGINTVLANSSWISGFRADLVVVISAGAFPSARVAGTELALASQCGVKGYSKYGKREPVGLGE